ncbi:MAG: peptide chain release factor 2 [Candidatus Magasanikbacteria bacterium CG10_big_fil_rev_8_21_14_0_10_47_10]|uniref:Peptide chain release factor 2 n=1 Tax=Candidatus Magasanikbacteria bacterium CG10_big_fil_rev_8_21_14_0_10_47_10 TaxID=1974652 RepID=A0A2H0TQT0_9BACT|nr:MAG: peptide chain release factor 2 [Candidatus Magasanikbacteria bacterium CG10_big_fil_rev_8_21_14_0_10_47_10]
MKCKARYNQSNMDMHDLVKALEDVNAKLAEIGQILDIQKKKERISELEGYTANPDFWKDQEKATLLSKELSDLQEEATGWEGFAVQAKDLLEMAKMDETDKDVNFREDIEKQYEDILEKIKKLEFVSLFDGKHDGNNAIVSFHAGAGGTEAQDWAQMLLRMILRFAEKKSWKTTILDESKGNEAGIKSATIRVEGRYAFGYLKSEHGTHRLVRISPFDAESMRHTSFANIEVIPEIELAADVEIDPKDLRIDTFMSSGKGGQSVNTTYSAVRIVHLPTGITVQCQNERSQLQNKETALKILMSKLQTVKEEEEEKERLKLRGEHKAAEWGNQIRSYVLHPYKMVKDIRTKYESSDPDRVLDGDIDECIEAYLKWKKGGKL